MFLIRTDGRDGQIVKRRNFHRHALKAKAARKSAPSRAQGRKAHKNVVLTIVSAAVRRAASMWTAPALRRSTDSSYQRSPRKRSDDRRSTPVQGTSAANRTARRRVNHSKEEYVRRRLYPHQHGRRLLFDLQARHERHVSALQREASAPLSGGVRFPVLEPRAAWRDERARVAVFARNRRTRIAHTPRHVLQMFLHRHEAAGFELGCHTSGGTHGPACIHGRVRGHRGPRGRRPGPGRARAFPPSTWWACRTRRYRRPASGSAPR